jgi:hypothetical protein
MDVMLYISNEKKDETSECVLDNLVASLILSDKGEGLRKTKPIIKASFQTPRRPPCSILPPNTSRN